MGGGNCKDNLDAVRIAQILMNISYMTEIDFFEIVEALCKRPKMYTMTGSFNEITAFLEGYGAGANVGEKSYHSAFTPFFKWIAEKFNLPEIIIGWDKFQAVFSCDDVPLKNLPILYKEYAESVATQD